MLVRDEDVTNARQRHIRKHKLPRDAVAAVNHIRGVVRDDDLRRRGTFPARTGTASRPEENESGTRTLSTDGSGTRCSTSNRGRQKSPTSDPRQSLRFYLQWSLACVVLLSKCQRRV